MKLRKDEKGFTLIELLIALVITGLIVAAATGTIFQIFQSTSASADMLAIRQVQTAGYWVSKDALQAQNITTSGNATGGNGFPLNLTWTDWDDKFHQIDYYLYKISNSTDLRQLWRQEQVTGTLPATIMVAQYIDPAPTKTNCAPLNKTLAHNETLTFTVTASVKGARGTQTETRTYEIKPRPSS